MTKRADHPIAHSAQLDWESTERGKTRFRRKRLAAIAGGQKLGCSMMELPPGAHSWPRHAHLTNEEAIFVLAGHAALRLGDDEEEIALSEGDYVALRVGDAHAMRNPHDSEPLRYLCFSTMEAPDVVLYPDSGKVGVFAGSPPGGDPASRTLHAYLPLASQVGYWEGEEG